MIEGFIGFLHDLSIYEMIRYSVDVAFIVIWEAAFLPNANNLDYFAG